MNRIERLNHILAKKAIGDVIDGMVPKPLSEARKKEIWDDAVGKSVENTECTIDPDELLLLMAESKDEAWRLQRRLRRIAEIIEAVDNRCMAAGGQVTRTLEEMTDDEMRQIYALAKEVIS